MGREGVSGRDGRAGVAAPGPRGGVVPFVAVLAAALGAGADALAATAAPRPIPATTADFFQPGTQPGPGVDGLAPASTCALSFCHGNFINAQNPGSGGSNADDEPHDAWLGGVMAQAARDPLWRVAVEIANRDVANAGEACIRCHAPAGWLAGRSAGGSLERLVATDFDGVSCSFCHRLVAPVLDGASPAGDEAILAALAHPLARCADEAAAACTHETDCDAGVACVPAAGDGRFVIDAADSRRGPIPVGFGRQDVPPTRHEPARTTFSPFHRRAEVCAPCHDVSTATYTRNAEGAYELNAFDTPGDPDALAGFPEQRTYSEWRYSDFATTGRCAAAPTVACAADADCGVGQGPCQVTTCQDCHMPDTPNKACLQGPFRLDMPKHSFAGGNTWIVRAVRDLCRAEIDAAAGAPTATISAVCEAFPVEDLLSRCAGALGRACATDAECDGDGPCLGRCLSRPTCASDAECGSARAPCVKTPATMARCAGDPMQACDGDAGCGAAGPCVGQCASDPMPVCATDADCAGAVRCVKDPVAVAEERTVAFLGAAADVMAIQEGGRLLVRVVNHSGHKLPTGYPEGRRMWLAVRFLDVAGALLREHGVYDTTRRDLAPPAPGTVRRVYEAVHTIDEDIAARAGLAAGTTFHLALNNRVVKDNRIPPRGFDVAAYDRVGAAPVPAVYADGQYWSDTYYPVPAGAVRAEVTLSFETTSRAYIEFVRDADPAGPGGVGALAYAQWWAHGRPVRMAVTSIALDPVEPGTTTTTATSAAPTTSTMTSTTTTSTTTTSTTSTSTTTIAPACRGSDDCDDGNPCTDDACVTPTTCAHAGNTAACDDGDRCTTIDECAGGRCVGRLADAAHLGCTLEGLTEAPCASEPLPPSLAGQIAKKVAKSGRFVEQAAQAAGQGKTPKVEKLRLKATRQLDSIGARAAKAVKKKQISAACGGALAALVAERRTLIGAYRF